MALTPEMLMGADPEFQRQFPKGWAKSARETKSNWLFGQTESAIQDAGNTAYSLNALEEERGQRKEDTYRQAGSDADVPTMSEQDINRLFARDAGASGDQFLGDIGNLRSMLGENGLTGASGWAAGLASDLESQRLSSLITSRRDLFVQKSTADAMDRLKKYDRMTQLAEVQGRAPSMIGSDWKQMLVGLRESEKFAEQNRSAAKDASNASKQAGLRSGFGGLAQGLGPVLAGL